MAEKYELDILAKEMREKSPHWLDPREKDRHKIDEKRQAIRDKHRAKAKAEKKFTFRERDRIQRRANVALGKAQRDAQDHADFMRQCIDQMVVDGEANDEGEAEILCQLLWEEEEDFLWD